MESVGRCGRVVSREVCEKGVVEKCAKRCEACGERYGEV